MIASLLFAALPLIDAHWTALLASPGVSVPGVKDGTGVVIGVKDGFGYLLTAEHVAAADRLELRFTSREHYPKTVWYGAGTVIARWPDPDVALVKFPLEGHDVPVVQLGPAWQRPKAFPAPALAVGAANGRAVTGQPDTILKKEFVRRDGKQPAFFWRTERPSEPGQSGGPLLDARGRVIGVTVAVRGGAGYHAHHDEIVAALKRDGHGWLVPGK